MLEKSIKYRVDGYSVELFGVDKKGKRTRWGDKIIKIYSEGKNVGQAVFSAEKEETQDSYCAEGKIYYFAPGSQFQHVLDFLRSNETILFGWCPVHDSKERGDGDAFFMTNLLKKL